MSCQERTIKQWVGYLNSDRTCLPMVQSRRVFKLGNKGGILQAYLVRPGYSTYSFNLFATKGGRGLA